MSEAITLVKDIQASIEKMESHNKTVMAGLEESLSANKAEAKDAIKRADNASAEITKLSASIHEMEQKLADGVKAGKASPETLGWVVAKSDAYKNYAGGQTTKMRVEANTITGQSGSPATNSDTLVEPDRLSGIIPGAFRSLRIKDVVPVGTTTSNSIVYPRELAFTNNSAETAEGASKPESSITFESVTANVATIPTFLKASKQILDDSEFLASYLDTRLSYAVEQRYDYEIIQGNGTGQNISGMTGSGNYTAFTPTSGENALDSVNRCIEAVYSADYTPTGIMMNPTDWFAIERLKVNAGTDDRYIIGDPGTKMFPMLWGLPVVISNNFPTGKVMVADFMRSYGIYDRQGVVVEMFEQDEANVQQNLLTIRAELRGTLATFVPAAVQYGSLTSS